MKITSRLGPRIGFALIILVFAWAALLQLRRTAPTSHRTVLRIAHYHLEAGAREAFDRAAADYEALHPDVQVEQIAVPLRLYATWFRTQLVGETVPDIMEIVGNNEELMSRHFLPLGAAIREPNPYNDGDLAGAAWRDTFLDRLSGGPSYYYNLLENYGIPLATSTVRMLYNRPLYRRLTGRDEPPKSYSEFLDVCALAARPVADGGLGIPPIAGARQTSDQLLQLLFSNQTQRLAIDIEPTLRMYTPGLDWQAAMLAGRWDLRSPAVLHALAVVRDVGRRMPPGFIQLQPQDALFTFTTGGALMMAASSQNAASIRAEAPFEVGVFTLPLPGSGDFALGPNAEIPNNPPAVFVVPRAGQTGLAVDFLRFLTSRRQAELFANTVRWPSSVRGVQPGPEVAPFMPDFAGYPPGILLDPGGSTARVYAQNLHRLVSPEGSVESFVSAIEQEYTTATREDVARGVKNIFANVTLLDSVLGATWPGSGNQTDDERDLARAAEITEAQTLQEETSYRRQFDLGRSAR